MAHAFVFGFAAQTSLIVCGLIVYWWKAPQTAVGAMGGLGAGLLLGAVAFDLVPGAQQLAGWQLTAWMLAGAITFVVSDRVVDKRIGNRGSAAMGIVIGSIIDGVPESLIFGIQIAAGVPVSTS
ncbi:MAG: hypothetical protein FDZ75_00855, partial [Actinobacteria bacterium]